MAAWSLIADTVANEFSDIRDLEQLVRLALRLGVAAALGGLLGLEREHAGKDAGVRTHMMVCLGAALFVLVSAEAGMEPADLSRVVQGVAAGIGFLCAGAILKSAGDDQVRGLTTSAGLWLTAAIGLAAGLGREGLAVLSTAGALAILQLERPVRRWVRPRPERARHRPGIRTSVARRAEDEPLV